MTTIERALEEFLSEQERRLKPRAYGECEEVVYLFEWYLHGFAYVYLSEEDGKYYDELCDKKGYCEIFGTEYTCHRSEVISWRFHYKKGTMLKNFHEDCWKSHARTDKLAT